MSKLNDFLEEYDEILRTMTWVNMLLTGINIWTVLTIKGII
jgi:hypothetical protein